MQSLAAVSQKIRREGLLHFFPLLSWQNICWWWCVVAAWEEKMLIDKMTKQINAELKAKKEGKLIWLA